MTNGRSLSSTSNSHCQLSILETSGGAGSEADADDITKEAPLCAGTLETH